MAEMKLGSLFHSAFPAGFPAQLPLHSCVEHPDQGKIKKVFSCFSLGLFPPLPNTPFQEWNSKKKGKGMTLKIPKLPHKSYYLGREPRARKAC